MPVLERQPVDASDVMPLTSPTSAVELRGIARRFGRRWPLRGVSLSVQQGTTLGLLGPNGSGKTTLLRVLASLLRPTRGTGTIFGHDLVRDAARIRTGVGLLGHLPGVYADLTARENLRFAARMLGVRANGAALAELLERVGLDGHGDDRARDFSSGMLRRLALARLMLRVPRLLLLDEPHAAFDAGGVALVHALARATREAGGVAVIATHAPERAADLLDRVVRLEGGRLIEVDARGDAGAR
ncbi:MAG: heme ABC exporter ATP-binding protein CcmA [Longimicrobiales bacterium]